MKEPRVKVTPFPLGGYFAVIDAPGSHVCCGAGTKEAAKAAVLEEWRKHNGVE